MRPISNIDFIPSDILSLVISFSADSIGSLICGGTISKAFCASSKVASGDPNSPVWEHSFRSRDALYRSLKLVPQFELSQSWRHRLRSLAKVSTVPSIGLIPNSGLQLRCADIVLHRHPTHGFLLHLSEFRGTVVVYALNVSPAELEVSSLSPSSTVSTTKTKLGQFHVLPEMPTGFRPRAPASTLLLVRGVNGQPIHAFRNLAGLLACARSAGEGGELCRWQFMECPAQSVKSLPKEYRLAPAPMRL